jgi:hypothetical protein
MKPKRMPNLKGEAQIVVQQLMMHDMMPSCVTHAQSIEEVFRLAAGPKMIMHLEAAAFFITTFFEFFPGFGLRTELENAKDAKGLGWQWSVEPFYPDGGPAGVDTADGHCCVFEGMSPLEPLLSMLHVFIEKRHELLAVAAEVGLEPAPEMYVVGSMFPEVDGDRPHS